MQRISNEDKFDQGNYGYSDQYTQHQAGEHLNCLDQQHPIGDEHTDPGKDHICSVKFGIKKFSKIFRLAWQKHISDWRDEIALSLE